MRITIRQKNLEITPSLRKYIEDKIGKVIQRRLKGIGDKDMPILDLEFGRTTRHHRKGDVYHAGASLSLGKKMVRVEADAQDIRAACDILEAEFDRSLQSFKERAASMQKRGSRAAKRKMRYDPAAQLDKRGRVRNEGN